ncbi:MAG: twin-arginine translocase subunit TatC [Bacteroidota bacterium]
MSTDTTEPRDKEEAGEEPEMSFFDHLEELRMRIIKALLGIVAAVIVCGYYSDWIVNKIVLRPSLLTNPPLHLINTVPYGQITFYMMVVIVAALIICSPLILWQLWKFVQPGLLPRERKYISSIVFYTTLCFLSGVAFAYFLMLPYMLQFFANFGTSGIQNWITIDEYMSFVLQLVLLSGLIFELPMVSYFLARLGLVTPAFMKHYRRHSIVVILFIAAVVTPTTDPITMSVFSIPMFILYEISIWVATIAQRKRETVAE